MKHDEIRAMLERWGNFAIHIRAVRAEIRQYERLYMELADTRGAKAPELSGVRSTMISAPVENAAIRLEAARRMYDEALQNAHERERALLQSSKEVSSAMEYLNETQRSILELRYLQKQTWPQIAAKMRRTETAVRMQEQRGLQTLESVMGIIDNDYL